MGRLSSLTANQWEAMCDRCGLCCELKEDGLAGQVKTGVACPLYDAKNQRCSDYENRKALAPWCVKLTPENIDHPVVRAILPDSCSYITWSEGLPKKEYEVKTLIPFNLSTPEFQARMRKVWGYSG